MFSILRLLKRLMESESLLYVLKNMNMLFLISHPIVSSKQAAGGGGLGCSHSVALTEEGACYAWYILFIPRGECLISQFASNIEGDQGNMDSWAMSIQQRIFSCPH